MQVGGEFRAVGEFDVLLPDESSVFEDANSLHVEVDVCNLGLDVNLADRDRLNLVGELVDAHEAFLQFPCLGVGKFHDFAEIAGLTEFRLVLLRECITFELLVELRLTADKMRHK